MKSFDGYLKKKFGDSYVLLAGGGELHIDTIMSRLYDDEAYKYSGSNPYYAHMSWNTNSDNRWYLRVSPESPRSIAVDWAYGAPWSGLTGVPSTFTPSAHDHTYINQNFKSTGLSNIPFTAERFEYGILTGDSNPPSDLTSLDSYSLIEYINLPWYGNSYGGQLMFGANSGKIGYRTIHNGTWRTIRELLHSSNYTDYTVTKTGSGASGTWNINITGTSNYLTGYWSGAFHPGDLSNAMYSSWTGSYYKLVTGGGYKTLVDYADNAGTLGGTAKGDLFTALTTNTTNAVSATIGGTTKNITVSDLSTSLNLGRFVETQITSIPNGTGWYRIAETSANQRGSWGYFNIFDLGTSSPCSRTIHASLTINRPGLVQLNGSLWSNTISKARLVHGNTSNWNSSKKCYFEIYTTSGNDNLKSYFSGYGWTCYATATAVSETIDNDELTVLVLNNNGMAAPTFSGNATSASKWLTARTFTIGNCSKSVDGSENITWSLSDIGVASHDHNLLLSYGDVAFSSMTSVPTNYLTYRIVSSGGNVLGDSLYEVLHLPWSSGDYGNYLIFGANNGRVGVKYKSSGEVRELLTNKNFTSFCNDTYVNVTGDTMTGSLTVTGGSISTNLYLYINAWTGYGSGSFSAWYNGSISKLVCSTDISAPNFYTTSDRSKKQNISLFSEHIRKFQLKDTEKWHYGVIAQEVPEMFRDGEEGNMTVNYNSVLSYYVGLLENRVKELENEILKLKNK